MAAVGDGSKGKRVHQRKWDAPKYVPPEISAEDADRELLLRTKAHLDARLTALKEEEAKLMALRAKLTGEDHQSAVAVREFAEEEPTSWNDHLMFRPAGRDHTGLSDSDDEDDDMESSASEEDVEQRAHLARIAEEARAKVRATFAKQSAPPLTSDNIHTAHADVDDDVYDDDDGGGGGGYDDDDDDEVDAAELKRIAAQARAQMQEQQRQVAEELRLAEEEDRARLAQQGTSGELPATWVGDGTLPSWMDSIALDSAPPPAPALSAKAQGKRKADR